MPDSLNHNLLCEELLAITGDIKEALVLHHLLCESYKIQRFERWLERRQRRMGVAQETHNPDGLIILSLDEIAERALVGSASTARRRCAALAEKGFLEIRGGAEGEWDNTNQYHVCQGRIKEALREQGYTLATVTGSDS